ncbi:MAG TPA: response regulator transcription factor [Polyangiaceae bacterium]|nr:response regulator transcription factor [Polyangiaceae bacterium]
MTARILLVEDEPDTRELLLRALKRAGYDCVAAEGPARALLEARRFGALDLVITDVVMGRDDRAGLHLMNDLRTSGFIAPVVIMTAFADVDKVKTALNQGAAYFVEKPFSAAALVEVVQRVLVQRGPEPHVLDDAGLTPKELRVARYLLQGLSSTEIAEREGNSPKTIRQHVTEVYSKCGVAHRAQFFDFVYRGVRTRKPE